MIEKYASIRNLGRFPPLTDAFDQPLGTMNALIVCPDQIFSEVGGVPLRFDLFRGDGPEAVPLVILIHDGGWIAKSKESVREQAIRLAEAGFAVACPNYRLAPLHPFPAAVQDCLTFLEFAKGLSLRWNFDSRRIAIFGESAGGHLASMTGLIGKGVRAVVEICGITDLTRPHEQQFPIAWSFIEQFMGVPYEGHERLYEDASPVFHVHGEAPRFMILHGDADAIVPIQQAINFSEALHREGVNHVFVPLPSEGHEFSPATWNRIDKISLHFLYDSFSYALR